MRVEFVKKSASGSHKLILIFAGWGSDPRLYAEIEPDGWDTAVVWDYTSDDFPIDFLRSYSTLYVYAWSMGVWAAARVLKGIKPDAAFAINGTVTPRDDRFGIPEQIYDATHDSLNERNLQKFRLRMAGDRLTAARLERLLPSPDIDGLKLQLRYIFNNPATPDFVWTRAYVSDSDRIFPSSSQSAYWQTHGVEVRNIAGAHYVDIERIVRQTVHDISKIGTRFGQALSTYDRHASAQSLIADRLAERLVAMSPLAGSKVLEIGAGSGLFTRAWAPILKPEEAHFIDLYPTPEYKVAPKEKYIVGNAEEWLLSNRKSKEKNYDAIVSASTMQWFESPQSFFHNASTLLKEGGLLAVSSFTKGNLGELDILRPTPLIYRTTEELRELASRYFEDLRVEEEPIPVRFSGPREALLHLKHTGVGGSMTTGAEGSELSRKLPREEDGSVILTYRPVYITGRKREDKDVKLQKDTVRIV